MAKPNKPSPKAAPKAPKAPKPVKPLDDAPGGWAPMSEPTPAPAPMPEPAPAPAPTPAPAPAPAAALVAGLRDGHSLGRARRASESAAVATLGSVACNLTRRGEATVKVQGFLALDVTLALRLAAQPGESNTATLERILRAAMTAGILPTPSPEAIADGLRAVTAALATKPIAPSAQARVTAPAVVRDVLK